MKKIILASTSPRRKEILEILGIPFEVMASSYDEDMTLRLEPAELVKHLSEGKAKDVAAKHSEGIIIGADTVVVFEGEIIGKPKDVEDARRMLADFNGKELAVITGFTVIDVEKRKTLSRSVKTKVFFRKLLNEDIERYLVSGEAMDKAGAFGIQGLGTLLIEKIEGDYYDVVGLPLSALVEALEEFGINVWKMRI